MQADVMRTKTDSPEWFGRSLALGGDWLVIGAPFIGSGDTSKAGSRFVYKADVSDSASTAQRATTSLGGLWPSLHQVRDF